VEASLADASPVDAALADASMAGREVVFGPSPPQAVSVARVGNLRWAELQVFTVVGSWVASTPEHEVRIALAGVSRHAAWRATVLADRLPAVGALATDVVTVPRHDDLVLVIGQMAALDATADRLAVLGDVVLAGLEVSVSALLGTLSPVADASALRALPMVIQDLNRDRATVSGLLSRADADADADPGVDAGAGAGAASGIAAALGAAGGW